MEIVNQLISFIKSLFDFWFLVMPWEQCVFVRAGSKTKLLTSGFYFKIPFLDKVFIQTTRMRMIDLSVQTISTSDNKTVTVKSAVSYSIADIFKLYNSMSHPEMTLGSMVMSGLAEYMRSNESTEVSPKSAEEYVNSKINSESFGLKDVSVRITSWCDVKTFRLIQDTSGIWEGLSMDALK